MPPHHHHEIRQRLKSVVLVRAKPHVQGGIRQKDSFGILHPCCTPTDELLQGTFVKGNQIVGRILNCQRRLPIAHQISTCSSDAASRHPTRCPDSESSHISPTFNRQNGSNDSRATTCASSLGSGLFFMDAFPNSDQRRANSVCPFYLRQHGVAIAKERFGIAYSKGRFTSKTPPARRPRRRLGSARWSGGAGRGAR